MTDRSQPTLSDIPCASLMIGDLEFRSRPDGEMIVIGGGAGHLYVGEHQAMQLFIWLSNHLRIKL